MSFPNRTPHPLPNNPVTGLPPKGLSAQVDARYPQSAIPPPNIVPPRPSSIALPITPPIAPFIPVHYSTPLSFQSSSPLKHEYLPSAPHTQAPNMATPRSFASAYSTATPQSLPLAVETGRTMDLAGVGYETPYLSIENTVASRSLAQADQAPNTKGPATQMKADQAPNTMSPATQAQATQAAMIPGCPSQAQAQNPTPLTPMSVSATNGCNATPCQDGKVTSPCKSRVQPPAQSVSSFSALEAYIARPRPVSIFAAASALSLKSPQSGVNQASSPSSTGLIPMSSLVTPSKEPSVGMPDSTQASPSLAQPLELTPTELGQDPVAHEALLLKEPPNAVGDAANPPKAAAPTASHADHADIQLGDDSPKSTPSDAGRNGDSNDDGISFVGSELDVEKDAASSLVLPRLSNADNMEDYVQQVIPCLYQALGIPVMLQPTAVVTEQVTRLLQTIQNGGSDDQGKSAATAIDVESHKPDDEKAAKQLKAEKQAVLALAARAAFSPTAKALRDVHEIVGVSNASIPLVLPPEAFALATIPEANEHTDTFKMHMSQIRNLEEGQMLEDDTIYAICRIKLGHWTIVEDRVFIPPVQSDAIKLYDPEEDHSRFVLATLPFLFDEHVHEIIWVLCYAVHWVTCVANANGVISVYNSLPGHKEHIATKLAINQMRVATSPPIIHEQWRDLDWSVQFMSCPVQTNGVDCGVFAIESAIELLQHGCLTTVDKTRKTGDLRLDYIRRIEKLVENSVAEERFTPTMTTEGIDMFSRCKSDGAATRLLANLAQNLPIATPDQVNAARGARTLWASSLTIKPNGLQLIWSQPKRTAPAIAAYQVSRFPNGVADRLFILKQYKNYPDRHGLSLSMARRQMKYFPRLRIIDAKNKYIALKNSNGATFPPPTPLFRLPTADETTSGQIKGTEQDPCPTLVVIQIRFSGGSYNVEDEELSRAAHLLKAYQRLYPIPAGVSFQRYRDADLDEDVIPVYGYFLVNQNNHPCDRYLIIDDDYNRSLCNYLTRAAEKGRNLHIVMVGNGIDGLTTNNHSWSELAIRFPKLTFEICHILALDDPVVVKFPHVAHIKNTHITSIRMEVTHLANAYRVMQARKHDHDPFILDNPEVVAQLTAFEAMVYVFELFQNGRFELREWHYKDKLMEKKPLQSLLSQYRDASSTSRRNTFFLGSNVANCSDLIQGTVNSLSHNKQSTHVENPPTEHSRPRLYLRLRGFNQNIDDIERNKVKRKNEEDEDLKPAKRQKVEPQGVFRDGELECTPS